MTSRLAWQQLWLRPRQIRQRRKQLFVKAQKQRRSRLLKKSSAKMLKHLAPKWKLPSLKSRESLRKWKRGLLKSRQGKSVRLSYKRKGSSLRSKSARRSSRLNSASAKFSSRSRENLKKKGSD